MNEHYSPAERALLHLLSAAFDRRDPVPHDVIAAAYRAGAGRGETSGCRLWELLWDTAVGPLTMALRGPGDGRMLSFGGAAGTVQIQLDLTGAAGLRLTGLVSIMSPPTATAVTVRWPDGQAHAAVDDIGRFAADRVPAGPLRLTVHEAVAPVAITPWFVG